MSEEEEEGMDDDFEELFERLFDADAEDDVPQSPRWRATIRSEKLQLTSWAPWLAGNGPAAKLFEGCESAGVAIADFSVAGDDANELIVRFHSTGDDLDTTEDVIVDWATKVGYRRVWLSDRLVSLEPSAAQIGAAEVRCPTCAAEWRADSPDFWVTVHRAKQFPNWCFLCGCELPQWTVTADYRVAPKAAKRGAEHGRWQTPPEESAEEPGS
ncbi:MAG: hypothetical protein ACR2OC_08465 [Solirubrobacterales bacterium]